MPKLPDGRAPRAALAMLVVGVVVGLVAMLTGSSSADAQSAPGAPLFRAVRAAAQVPTSERGVVRSRNVAIDLPQLGGSGRSAASKLELNLFDDVTLTAVLQRSEPTASGGAAWVGKVDGDPASLVALVSTNGTVGGTVATIDKLYRVGLVGGSPAVMEIDRRAFPNELPPVDPGPLPAAEPSRSAMADDGSTIDVMVVYTADAAAGAVGSGGIDALIDLAITETNASFLNSGITQRMRLVHKAQVSYSETGNSSTDLSRLRSSSDGYMDEVHTLRNQYGADEVVFLAEDIGDACGVAYLMSPPSTGFASSAFAVVARSCATGYYSFGHELGHTMGAHHDRYVAPDDGAYSYSHGYVSPTNVFRTVMAYSNACTTGPCTRVPYWSNPLVAYLNGQAMGVAEGSASSADNARTLNNTAIYVANFRQSVVGGTATPTPTATRTPTRTPTPTVTPTPTPTPTPRAVIQLTPAATNVVLTPVAGMTLSLPSVPTPAGGGAVTIGIDTVAASALPTRLGNTGLPVKGIVVDLTIDGIAYHGTLAHPATITLDFTGEEVPAGTNPLTLKLFLSSDGANWEMLTTTVADFGGGSYRATASVPHFSQVALAVQQWRVLLPSGTRATTGW